MTKNKKDEFEMDEFSLSEMSEKEVAFVKSDIKDGEAKWYIYSSDGTKIAEANSREFAFILAKQNDFAPCSVH